MQCTAALNLHVFRCARQQNMAGCLLVEHTSAHVRAEVVLRPRYIATKSELRPKRTKTNVYSCTWGLPPITLHHVFFVFNLLAILGSWKLRQDQEQLNKNLKQ